VGKPRVLVLTTALHHKHRFRLHNFLPYLAKHLDIDAVDVPQLSYDIQPTETTWGFIARVMKELATNPIKEKEVNNIKALTVRSLLPGDFGALASTPLVSIALNKLRRRRYSTILATPFLAGLIALRARRALGDTPVVYEDVDRFNDFFRNPLKKAIARAIEYTVIRESNAVIAVSPHLYGEDLEIRSGRETYLVPNGIEYRRFRESARRARERDRYAIVYVGAVEWWSGLDIAVKALKIVKRSIPNAKLYVIGEHRTPFGFQLVKLVKKLELSENVVFLGRKPYDYVIEFLPRCRVGILTFPRSEVTEKAFPYKVLEYCASGTPVIMTRVTVLYKLVETYRAGRVHEVHDIEGLAKSMAELITSDDMWREFSENAAKLASLFDVAKLAELEAQILKSVSS